MISLKEICLFMVIIFSCSLNANGVSLKNFTTLDLANEVNENPSELLKAPSELRTPRDASDNENYDDGYVVEDMNLVQNDQPSYMRQPHHYGRMQKDAQEKYEQKKRFESSQSPNLQLTKEVLIKQGPLKGLLRSMHPQTGLRNVRQYLGIPYAAAPIGINRFMPPGLFPFCLFRIQNNSIQIRSNSMYEAITSLFHANNKQISKHFSMCFLFILHSVEKRKHNYFYHRLECSTPNVFYLFVVLRCLQMYRRNFKNAHLNASNGENRCDRRIMQLK